MTDEQKETGELEQKLGIPGGENAEKTRGVVLSFVQSYMHKSPETSNAQWLESEFSKYPKIWEDEGEAKNTAQAIVETVERYENEREKLAEHKAKGISQESYLAKAIEDGAKAKSLSQSYLAKAIEDGAKANGVVDVGKYAAEIDKAIDKANADNAGLASQEHSADIARDEAQEAQQYEWNHVNRKNIAKNIGQKAGIAALFAVGVQGTRILGRRVLNTITGKENKTAEEDAQEFAEKAIKSGASAGLTVAATGGITVAAKSEWLGDTLKNTPVVYIANAVSLGIENAKTLYKWATGEINREEAVEQTSSAAHSMVGSIALNTKGASTGAAIETVFGPAGVALGSREIPGMAGLGEIIGTLVEKKEFGVVTGVFSFSREEARDAQTREGENRTELNA
ncbi:MAG: hypothetical protein FWG66_10150 [Spirochaetes bacterium]|nr:hypothetical protein [Spirochaetota bacterium]